MLATLRRPLLVLVLLPACTGEPARDDGPAMCGQDALIASGTVEREFRPHAYNDRVDFGPGSAAVLAIYTDYGHGHGPPMEKIAEQVIRPAPQPPFEFCIGGDLSKLRPGMTYDIRATLYQTEGTRQANDLTDEYGERFEAPATHRRIRVSGVESCDAPGSGGFCHGLGR